MDFGPLAHGDPLAPGIASPNPRLENFSTGEVASHALGFMQELTARVRAYCENPDVSEEVRAQAGQLLVNVARDTTMSLHTLMAIFPAPFEAVAQNASMFPCLLPAHPGERAALERYMLKEVGLGKLHSLKIASRRKTFSMETDANRFLLYYLQKIRLRVAQAMSERVRINLENLCVDVPLDVANAKQWMEAIWTLLLDDIPEPEKHPRLQTLGQHRKNHAEDRYGKLTAKTSGVNVRAGIKESLGKYLVRMLRSQGRKVSDK